MGNWVGGAVNNDMTGTLGKTQMCRWVNLEAIISAFCIVISSLLTILFMLFEQYAKVLMK